MPNTNTSTVLVSGLSEVIIHTTIASDGTQETDYIIYDSSVIATLIGQIDPLKCKINCIKYSTNSPLGKVFLEYDATTDVLAWAMPYANSLDMCFKNVGGLKNVAGAGITGDITLTTTGLAIGDKISLVLSVRPF